MKTWVTTIGEKPFAAVNTLWAFLHEEQTDEIEKLVIFYSEDARESHLLFTTWAEALFAAYRKKQPRLQTITYPTDNIKVFRNLFKKNISLIKTKILIDMTSGRKAMSAIMLLLGELFPGKVEKVYYTFLADADYMNFPYPTIPHGTGLLHNMLET